MNNSDLKYISTDHFNLQEFANSLDQNKIKLDLNLVFMLNEFRKLIERSITVTSGYRTPAFNKKSKGDAKSEHLEGKAADIKFNMSGYTNTSLKSILVYLGFQNIGFYWKDGIVGGSIDRLHVGIRKNGNGKVKIMNWHENGKFINKIYQ